MITAVSGNLLSSRIVICIKFCLFMKPAKILHRSRVIRLLRLPCVLVTFMCSDVSKMPVVCGNCMSCCGLPSCPGCLLHHTLCFLEWIHGSLWSCTEPCVKKWWLQFCKSWFMISVLLAVGLWWWWYVFKLLFDGLNICCPLLSELGPQDWLL